MEIHMNVILTENTLDVWKQDLDKRMKSVFGYDNYSSFRTDEDWLDEYEGKTVDDVINDEYLND